MKKLKLLLMAAALFGGVCSVNAQKDVTSQYITNATLAQGYNTGWTSTGFHAGPTQGNNTVGYTVECWAGDNNGNPLDARKNFSLTQDITLPAGSYRLVNYSFYRQSWGATDDASKSLAYLKAGDQQTKIVTLGSITGQASYANNMAEAANRFDTKMYRNVVEFTVAADNTVVNIGITGTHDTAGSWFICGMFELFDLDDVATVSSPTDMTYAITNPGFEYGNLTGWTNSITQGNNTYATNNNFASKYGVGFYESWKSGVALGNAGTFTQTLANMPAGLYELSVYAQNVEQYNGDAGGTGMFLKANNDQTQIGSRNQYKVRTTLQSDGDLTIGINLDNCTGNWIAFDRFELQFYGDPLKAYQDLLDEAVAGAQALINGTAGSAISATAKAAWQDVVDDNDNDPKTFTQESQFTAAIENINNANTNYQAMAAPYALWLKVKAGADAMALVANNNASATSTLTDAISTQNTAAEDAKTPAALNTAISTLRTAIRDFINDAEPTGGAGFEITCLIGNPDFDGDITEWTYESAPGVSYSNAEFFNKTFDIYQTLTGLPNGSYQLTVQAFSRPGGNDVAYPAYLGGTNSVTAELYVNNDASTVGNIYAYTGNTAGIKATSAPSYWQDYECEVDGGTNYWVPNGQEGAKLYFADADVYKTTVAALVDNGELKLGFRDSKAGTSYWTIFDNFHLYYYGSDKLVYYQQYLPQLRTEVSADLSNGAYANVLVSSEDEALDAALAADPASETETAYETVINNLKDAQAAFRAAAASYDAMDAAKAYTELTEITANIGSGVFQYPENIASLWNAYFSAKSAVDNYEFTTSSTAAGAQALVDALDNAISNYKALNAPNSEKRYWVSIVEDGKDWNGNAITFIAGGRNGEGNYAIKYLTTSNANLCQAIKFTATTGNKYKMSVLNADGTEQYLTTNSLAYGSNKNQIRMTDDASKALEVEIKATSTSGQFQLYNTEADAVIANNNNNDMYTANSCNFTIAEASQASVEINIDGGIQYATRIFPFAPTTWPNGVVAYSCGAASDDVLTLEEVATPAANVPYILFAENGSTGSISGWGTAGKTSYTAGWLTGVYTDTDAPVGSYVLQKNDKVAFYVVADNEQPTVGANRCYLTWPQAEARAFYFPENNATAIKTINALTSGKAEIFNASGVQIPALQKGMNIIRTADGKSQKVMVK